MGRNVKAVRNSEKFLECGPIKDDDGNEVVAKQVGAKEFWGKYDQKYEHRNTSGRKTRSR